jgi:hypothetical protein
MRGRQFRFKLLISLLLWFKSHESAPTRVEKVLVDRGTVYRVCADIHQLDGWGDDKEWPDI